MTKREKVFLTLGITVGAAALAGGVYWYLKKRAEMEEEEIQPDAIEFDTDGDGVTDMVMMDTTGDGQADTLLVDTTGDGVLDTAMVDLDGDGVADIVIDTTADSEEAEKAPEA